MKFSPKEIPLETAVVGKLYCLRCKHYQKNVGLLTRHKSDLDGNLFVDQIYEDVPSVICMMLRYNHTQKHAIVLVGGSFLRIDARDSNHEHYKVWLESCNE